MATPRVSRRSGGGRPPSACGLRTPVADPAFRRGARLGRGWRSERGILVISAYLMLALFLVYSNTMTLNTVTQRVASDRLRERLQALDLAQGAAEQLREDVYEFLSDLYQNEYDGNAIQAMEWLNAFQDWLDGTGDAPDPPFDLAGRLGERSGASGDGTDEAHPRTVTGLSTGQGQAWIKRIRAPNGDFAAREVVVEAFATVGQTTKRIQVTFSLGLGAANVFRYAYFVNNLGWFEAPLGTWIDIFGESRSNGDLKFGTGSFYILGDLYASKNEELDSEGLIVNGSRAQEYGSVANYMDWRGKQSRPGYKPVVDGQPAIGKGGAGADPWPNGFGWDFNYRDQRKYERQDIEPIPYLGNLSYYRDLAADQDGTVTYTDPRDGSTHTITHEYLGPDGVGNSGDENTPVVITGTDANPIRIDGPVVIPGDVIIKGVIAGQGTLYAGRNVHVIGEIRYATRARWRAVERDTVSGQLRQRGATSNDSTTSWDETNLGKVDSTGHYTPP